MFVTVSYCKLCFRVKTVKRQINIYRQTFKDLKFVLNIVIVLNSLFFFKWKLNRVLGDLSQMETRLLKQNKIK